MIVCLTGNLSGGKTVTAVKWMLEDQAKGKKLLANIRMQGAEFMSYSTFVDFLKYNMENQKAMREKFYNKSVLLDEASQIISSRSSMTNLNALVLSWIVMVSKLDCNVYITAQVKTSMVDIVVRELMDISVECYRIDKDGKPIIFGSRIVDNIRIVAMLEIDLGFRGVKRRRIVYDPSPYFKYYDTREITLLDRAQYLSGGAKDLRKK